MNHQKTLETIKRMFWTTTLTESVAPVSQKRSRLVSLSIFKSIIKAKLTRLVTCLKIKKLLPPKLQMVRLTFLTTLSTQKHQ